MEIKSISNKKEKIIIFLHKIILKLENNGNSEMETNGEKLFISDLVNYYKNDNLTIFDIGANQGEYSDYLLDLFKDNSAYSLHLFEPQKSCFNNLLNKYSNNKKITINNFGLSDKSENLNIYYNEEKSGLASLYKRDLDYYDIKMDKSESINLKRTDEYIETNNIKKNNLIKIDVEGHEIKAFEGFGKYLNSDFIDFIQFEYGGANIDSRTNLLDFYHVLSKNGFKICKIMKNHLEIRKYNPRYDNFIYQNYVAINNNILKHLLNEK